MPKNSIFENLTRGNALQNIKIFISVFYDCTNSVIACIVVRNQYNNINIYKMKAWEKKILNAAVQLITNQLHNKIDQTAEKILNKKPIINKTIDLKETDYKIIK